MIIHMLLTFYGMVWIYLYWYKFFENVSAQIFLPGMRINNNHTLMERVGMKIILKFSICRLKSWQALSYENVKSAFWKK